MKRLAIALALGMSFAAPVCASAQPMMHNSFYRHHAAGRIVSVQGSSFTLDSGRTVFLKQGTVINPTGIRLRSGLYVNVTGHSAGDRNINAAVVNVGRRY